MNLEGLVAQIAKKKHIAKYGNEQHEYEDYFYTDCELAIQKQWQQAADNIFNVMSNVGISMQEFSDAMRSIITSGSPSFIDIMRQFNDEIQSIPDEKELARQRSRNDLNSKRKQSRKGNNRHIMPRG